MGEEDVRVGFPSDSSFNICGSIHIVRPNGFGEALQGEVCIRQKANVNDVTIDYLYGASFLLIRTTRCMFPLGLCEYLEDWYVFSLGPRCFSFAPFPEDTPTPVPLLLFAS